jgi:hypothetical protein
MSLYNYQADGFSKNSKTALNDCNRSLNSAKVMTPEKYHHLFRSYIRWDGDGYIWGWVLK